jgi:hypothetical protein
MSGLTTTKPDAAPPKKQSILRGQGAGMVHFTAESPRRAINASSQPTGGASPPPPPKPRLPPRLQPRRRRKRVQPGSAVPFLALRLLSQWFRHLDTFTKRNSSSCTWRYTARAISVPSHSFPSPPFSPPVLTTCLHGLQEHGTCPSTNEKMHPDDLIHLKQTP